VPIEAGAPTPVLKGSIGVGDLRAGESHRRPDRPEKLLPLGVTVRVTGAVVVADFAGGDAAVAPDTQT
jgi:hypothetical protein